MNALIIFIKNPELGKVKTRLATSVGNKNALIIYNYLLDHTREISSELELEKYLFYDEKINFNDNWPNEQYKKHIQTGKDLGEKMQNAFQTAFQNGHSQVVIIGSDCLELNTYLIIQAFKNLENHDFVIGPAIDGGYYLLGMKSLETCLFENKNWSTNTVAAETLNDFRLLQKSFCILTELSDIDTENDLTDELKNLIR